MSSSHGNYLSTDTTFSLNSLNFDDRKNINFAENILLLKGGEFLKIYRNNEAVYYLYYKYIHTYKYINIIQSSLM